MRLSTYLPTSIPVTKECTQKRKFLEVVDVQTNTVKNEKTKVCPIITIPECSNLSIILRIDPMKSIEKTLNSKHKSNTNQ